MKDMTEYESEKESFREHLRSKGFRISTIEGTERYVRRFSEWLDKENLLAKDATYNDLLSFVKECHKKEYSRHTVNCHLRGVQHYYDWLVKHEKAQYNPVVNLRVKGVVEQLPGDLLSSKQFELLYESYQAISPTQKRNKIMIGLFVYQGIMLEELEQMEPSDINLEKGLVRIRRAVRLQSRVLKLKAPQVLPLHEYLNEVRPQLLTLKGSSTEKLFITTGSSDHLKEVLRELMKVLRKQHLYFMTFMQVRNSVISQWLKSYNIREVQYMAGHNNIISTQRYVRANLDELKEQVSNYHPLA